MMSLHAPQGLVYIALLASSGNAPKGGLHCPTGKLYNASEEVGKIWYTLLLIQKIKATQSGQP